MASGPLRCGGRGSAPGGDSIVWSVAEGTKGRRWREVRLAGQGIGHSLLLETDPIGRFAHLELSTPSGLLTLHPEGDGTLHGHAVVSDGVEHVVGEAWEPGAIVAIERSPICVAAAAPVLADRMTPFGSAAIHAAWIPSTLWLEVKPLRVERVDERTWRFGDDPPLALDERGLPLLIGGEIWPLERDAEVITRHR